MKAKKIIPLVIIAFMVLAISSISIYSFCARDKNNEDNQIKPPVVQEPYQQDENIIQEEQEKSESQSFQTENDKEQPEEKVEDSRNKKTLDSPKKETNKNDNEEEKKENNNQNEPEVSKPKEESKVEESKSEIDPEPVKEWTDAEIEKYVKQTISDFRLDFKTLEACENEGNSWMALGWGYGCTHLEIPDTNIVASMLTIFTGDIYCDGDWTGSHDYYFKNSKIGNIAYLRTLGYKCENIHGDIY